MAKIGSTFGSVNRIERQQKSARNKLYKEVINQGRDAIVELTESIQGLQAYINGMEGVGTKQSYTFSIADPGEATISIENGQVIITLPNVIGNRDVFVQITENSASNELISGYVGITEENITLAIPASSMGNQEEYTAVVFG